MDEKKVIKINNGISLMGSILDHIEIYVEDLYFVLNEKENEDDIRDEIIKIVITNLLEKIKDKNGDIKKTIFKL